MQRESRRNFFKKALMGLAIVPVLKVSDIYAAACSKGPAKNPKIVKKMISAKKATQLAYVDNAAQATDKKYKAGSTCGDCKFYKADKTEPTFGKCSMAGQKYVRSCGWCKLYKLDSKKKKA